MEPATLLLMIIALLIAFLNFTRVRKLRSPKKLPPGNLGLPLIGETLSFLKPYSAATIGEFMEHHISRFGKNFSSHLFGNLSIVSTDPELIWFVLKNEGKLFRNDLSFAFKKVVGKYSMSLASGDVHKHLRSTVLGFLSIERLRTVFLQDADHVAVQIMSSWKDGIVISAKDEATKKIMSMSIDNPHIEKLPREYDSFIKAFVCFPLYIPGTKYWKAIQSRKYINDMFKKEMEARIEAKGGRNEGEIEDDFLGWLMKNTDYPQEKICDLLLGVLFAGHDTTSRAISLLIYFLESCPTAVEQLREEHLQIVRSKKQNGEYRLTWDDYKKMEFTKCVINETLRLGNIARFTLRCATKDTEFKDHVIPNGSTVLLHFGAVHMDPSLYEDPTQFNPWRWLSSPGMKATDSFMPFGKGLRTCPGADLARLEMAVFLHHLIPKFDWELAEPDHPIITPLVEFPRGLLIKVRAVSAC
ncbi:uncharacterized protein A4U43_C01F23290 [Asparagus officinalis]|uniref:Cytochrome P450 n=1 Tax=Asparagus officinalis TaxID=4686 RepID=A0A5P1FTC7_ASPOF|nr:uncharacterized protein A4U43_C01F23290 [Asparagus officinalis]